MRNILLDAASEFVSKTAAVLLIRPCIRLPTDSLSEANVMDSILHYSTFGYLQLFA